MPNRIHLKGPFQTDELDADEIITPGQLVERMATGLVQKASSQDAPSEALFALEDALQGKTIDDDYAANTKVQILVAAKGTEVFSFLKGGVTAADGIELSSGGDGTLILATGTDYVVALAQEALDLNALPAARMSVRVI